MRVAPPPFTQSPRTQQPAIQTTFNTITIIIIAIVKFPRTCKHKTLHITQNKSIVDGTTEKTKAGWWYLCVVCLSLYTLSAINSPPALLFLCQPSRACVCCLSMVSESTILIGISIHFHILNFYLNPNTKHVLVIDG